MISLNVLIHKQKSVENLAYFFDAIWNIKMKCWNEANILRFTPYHQNMAENPMTWTLI